MVQDKCVSRLLVDLLHLGLGLGLDAHVLQNGVDQLAEFLNGLVKAAFHLLQFLLQLILELLNAAAELLVDHLALLADGLFQGLDPLLPLFIDAGQVGLQVLTDGADFLAGIGVQLLGVGGQLLAQLLGILGKAFLELAHQQVELGLHVVHVVVNHQAGISAILYQLGLGLLHVVSQLPGEGGHFGLQALLKFSSIGAKLGTHIIRVKIHLSDGVGDKATKETETPVVNFSGASYS